MATKEYFPGIGKIKFEGKESKNPRFWHMLSLMMLKMTLWFMLLIAMKRSDTIRSMSFCW